MDQPALLAIRLLGSLRNGVGDRFSEAPASWVDWLATRKVDSLYYIDGAKPAVTQEFYDKVWRVQRRETIAVLTALKDAGLKPLVFKGAEFVEAFFNPHCINVLADTDLLVPRSQIPRVKPVLFVLGYRQAYFCPTQRQLLDRDVADVASIEGSHYELAPFTKLLPLELTIEEVEIAKEWNRPPIWTIGDRGFVAVEFDVHHAVATDIESDQFFERAVASSFPNAWTLCAADHVWFTITRLYTEVALHGKISLRDFSYLVPLLERQTIDWAVVLDAAKKFHVEPPLFYYLSFLSQLVPGKVPATLLNDLTPLSSERQRDWGWQLEKLFEMVSKMPVEVTCD